MSPEKKEKGEKKTRQINFYYFKKQKIHHSVKFKSKNDVEIDLKTISV